MRFPATIFALLLVMTIGVVVYAVKDSRGDFADPYARHDYPPFKNHPPRTADERAAAQTALRFAHLAQQRDTDAACDLMAGKLRTVFRCAQGRRRPSIYGCLGDRAQHALQQPGGIVEVHVDKCWLTLARRTSGWRVIEWSGPPGVA